MENPEDKGMYGAEISLKPGLYIVATPIGNLRDITLRALDVLKHADVVMCEDTRVTAKLFNAFDIKTKRMTYHDHSDQSVRDAIIDRVQAGEVVALVSDAGMPLISDPGYKLVRACLDQGIYVTSLPGANAPLAALQLSGLPSDKFCFLGFMPNKTQQRQKLLKEWQNVPATLMAFETAPRLLACLKDIAHVLEGREVAVVREITKYFEESRKASPQDLIAHYDEAGLPKGEIVIVIEPPQKQEIGEDDVLEMIRVELESKRTKDAVSAVAEKTGMKKNILYDMALKIEKEDEKL